MILWTVWFIYTIFSMLCQKQIAHFLQKHSTDICNLIRCDLYTSQTCKRIDFPISFDRIVWKITINGEISNVDMQMKNNYDSGKSVAFPLHMRIVWLTVYSSLGILFSHISAKKTYITTIQMSQKDISNISHSVPLFSVCLLRRSKHIRDVRIKRNIKHRSVDQMLDENN